MWQETAVKTEFHSFTDKKSTTRIPVKIFQDPFGASECLNIKKKTASTSNIQYLDALCEYFGASA